MSCLTSLVSYSKPTNASNTIHKLSASSDILIWATTFSFHPCIEFTVSLYREIHGKVYMTSIMNSYEWTDLGDISKSVYYFNFSIYRSSVHSLKETYKSLGE